MNAINTLPPDLIQEWYDVCYKLPVLSHISIPRWTSHGTDTEFVELHGFSDASRPAYSAVLYMRVVTKSGQISVKILMSKTKVATVKTLSIPNLELCAAALLTKLILFAVQSLQLDDMPIFCWTDSTIVLDLATETANYVAGVRRKPDFYNSDFIVFRLLELCFVKTKPS